MKVYAIILGNGFSKELDQVCYSKQEAGKERKDLIKSFGFEPSEVKIIPFDSESELYDYMESKGIHH